MTDIIDVIDALIDEQLAAGEPETGYDFDDPQYPDCPHCHRGWHGLRITERIEAMHRIGQFDPDYRVADDDTPVVCEGSEFIGPRRPTEYERLQASWGMGARSVNVEIGDYRQTRFETVWTMTMDYVTDSILSIIVGGTLPSPNYRVAGWGSGQASWQLPPGSIRVFTEDWQPLECPGGLPDVSIEFGPRTWWHYELAKHRQIARQPTGYTTHTPPRPGAPWLPFWTDPLAAVIQALWPQFTTPDFPIPPSSGYDFTKYADDTVSWPQHRLDGRIGRA